MTCHLRIARVTAIALCATLLVALVITAALAAPVIDITTDARALQPGELVVIILSVDRNATGVLVRAFDRTTPAFRTGDGVWQALLGIDLDQPAGTYMLSARGELGASVVTGTHQLVIRPKRFATRTLRVAPEYVNPPPAVQDRIVREVRFLREVYAHSTDERLWDAPFLRPVPDPASSRFGQRSVFNGEPRSPHAGTDFMSGAGRPIKAPNAGRLVAARELYFSGHTVIIDHGLGVFSTLAHLSRIDVREGDSVAPGDIVGLVGATGRVTGPHLHWALRISDARVDPLSLLALLGEAAATR